jgi:hypothetical protein
MAMEMKELLSYMSFARILILQPLPRAILALQEVSLRNDSFDLMLFKKTISECI